MTIENFLITACVVLFFLMVAMGLYCSRYFKRNTLKYNELLSEYRGRDLDLDMVTNYAVFFGSVANYQKIIWFVRLYKGVKMKFTKDRYVQKEAYQFVQSLPEERIGWLLKVHQLYIIQFYLTALWILAGALIIWLYK